MQYGRAQQVSSLGHTVEVQYTTPEPPSDTEPTIDMFYTLQTITPLSQVCSQNTS